jgi:RimJ/RimL family protein N-acetyltransferase
MPGTITHADTSPHDHPPGQPDIDTWLITDHTGRHVMLTAIEAVLDDGGLHTLATHLENLRPLLH